MRNIIPRSEDGRMDISSMGDFHDKLEKFSKEVAERLLKEFPDVDFFDLESSFKSQFNCQYACAMMIEICENQNKRSD